MQKLESTSHEKFLSIPLDKDTKIKSVEYLKVGDYDAKIENWFWEGITASSLIFLKSDVAHLPNSELVNLIKFETEIGDNLVFKDTGEFLFFSYGFRD